MGADMKTKIVTIQAAPGRKSFCRGGHRFPEEGRTVEVTEELLAVIDAEPYLKVSDPKGATPEAGILEFIDNYAHDRAHNASAGAREELERVKAETAALRAELELEEAKKARDEVKAALDAKKARDEAKKAKPEKP